MKAQDLAYYIIQDFLSEGRESFTWRELSDAIKSHNITVKNWITIRSVLQYYIKEGLIARHDDIRTESYISLIK